MTDLTPLRHAIRQATHEEEGAAVAKLLQHFSLPPALRQQARDSALSWVAAARAEADRGSPLEAFLREFGLSNKEGIALLCLAESLLRIPDADTADALIAEKIRCGEWHLHLGHSPSLFVNASTWGLMLSGRWLQPQALQPDSRWFERLLNRLGEPVIRRAMLQGMKLLGGQFVLGRSLPEARKRGEHLRDDKTCFSYDMLGEAARGKTLAARYFSAYAEAIAGLAASGRAQDPHRADGISIKLSALHPRYTYWQQTRVKKELFPRLLELALAAKNANITLNIDAEEAERLELSLDLFQSLLEHPALSGWDGLGFVLQAYQKRAAAVAHWLVALAANQRRRIAVRLVKGAYWDYEIKRAQEQGHADYPVFTRKANTDLSYQACAQILLQASDWIYPQFATHNALSIALVTTLAGEQNYELQRLHGMGESVYRELAGAAPVRIYAPVGAHRELLPYLVRRLLENGANTSFVNRLLDPEIPVEALVSDVETDVQRSETRRHPRIPLPAALFIGDTMPRNNAPGVDLYNPEQVASLQQGLAHWREQRIDAHSLIGGQPRGTRRPTVSPFDHQPLGSIAEVDAEQVEEALDAAAKAQAAWDALGGDARAACFERLAKGLIDTRDLLLSLLGREAGRTLGDAVGEWRETIDFCHYYAACARRQFGPAQILGGPTGEHNALSLHGRGVFVCISPWNFPLAIFCGQILGALGAGNTVLAKPAPQTPLIAYQAVRLMHEAGIPANAVQLLCGGAELGAACVGNPNVAGVAFTGSTRTAKSIQRRLAENPGPIVPLIAETGGINAMIVDSSALLEQVCDDVLSSAFASAGQRCSALRVLFVQDDIADPLLQMLCEACEELQLGDPQKLSSDIGPLIDRDALVRVKTHVERMRVEAKQWYPRGELTPEDWPQGQLFAPHIFELQRLDELQQEVFGPVLHVIRYAADALPEVIKQINHSGHGLTLGVHSRLEHKATQIFQATRVGNTYVNRNMIGAVVGVNPFGGQGLSGTGPKAGGPHYLLRFASEKTLSINTVATGGNTTLLNLED